MGRRSSGTHHSFCLQAEEKKYELMGGCGQQRFLQENEGESGPDVPHMWWLLLLTDNLLTP